MTDDELEGRIRATIARTLGISLEPADACRMGSTPGWDSVGHMTIVMAVESEFGASFPAHRLPDLVDAAAIARVLRESPDTP